MQVRSELISKYADAVRVHHEAIAREVLSVTDQEVNDSINQAEETFTEEDVLYDYFQEHPKDFYILTGFRLTEFNSLWPHCLEQFSVSTRGRKSKVSPRDILIILLHYIKRYPRIEEMSVVFHLKTSTLQTLISKYIPILAKVMKNDFIIRPALEPTTYDQHFPECDYVVDATVQEICKPSLSFDIAKKYFSGKHYMYCLKSQVIVTLKGVAVSIVTGIEGATHDKRIFDSSLGKEIATLFQYHPNETHKILADKGYQDPNSDILVTPHKGNSAELTKEQLAYNQRLGEIRIIVENFFGRLKARYEIMSSIYRGNHDNYADLFTICCGLVNFEQIICNHPLREDDRKYYLKLQASIRGKNLKEIEKAKEKRKKQARNRRANFEKTTIRDDDYSTDDE